jgi:hypothetical protein
MRISSSIEDPSVIRAILDHLGIWIIKSKPPPISGIFSPLAVFRNVSRLNAEPGLQCPSVSVQKRIEHR